jgi:hypothetical protein
MYQFKTYRIGKPTQAVGGWYWQVTKDFGPIELVVAQSGISYLTEEDAIQGYKEMIKWACGTATTPPPAEE